MKLIPILNKEDKTIGFIFYCPGCQENHSYNIQTGDNRPVWFFNGDLKYPTFRPSLLIKSGCKTSDFKESECWCNYEERTGKPAPYKCGICHFYVTDGKIQYLSDCTHEFAGRIIELEEIP